MVILDSNPNEEEEGVALDVELQLKVKQNQEQFHLEKSLIDMKYQQQLAVLQKKA